MKSDLMKYKGYSACIYYDSTDNIFVGEVLGINDSLNFHGASITELKNSFHQCIDNYLDFCKQIGKEPQKEYSGRFNVRVTSQLHEQAAEYAHENNITLNQVIAIAMDAFLNKKTI